MCLKGVCQYFTYKKIISTVLSQLTGGVSVILLLFFHSLYGRVEILKDVIYQIKFVKMSI